ncbi:MAG: hypothetical protein JNK48_05425 [Bryobacterales bacterium]|nr:hypothetical protein [Bryobacterales bacterium]
MNRTASIGGGTASPAQRAHYQREVRPEWAGVVAAAGPGPLASEVAVLCKAWQLPLVSPMGAGSWLRGGGMSGALMLGLVVFAGLASAQPRVRCEAMRSRTAFADHAPQCRPFAIHSRVDWIVINDLTGTISAPEGTPGGPNITNWEIGEPHYTFDAIPGEWVTPLNLKGQALPFRMRAEGGVVRVQLLDGVDRSAGTITATGPERNRRSMVSRGGAGGGVVGAGGEMAAIAGQWRPYSSNVATLELRLNGTFRYYNSQSGETGDGTWRLSGREFAINNNAPCQFLGVTTDVGSGNQIMRMQCGGAMQVWRRTGGASAVLMENPPAAVSHPAPRASAVPFAGRWMDYSGYTNMEISADGTFALFDGTTGVRRSGTFQAGATEATFNGRRCSFTYRVDSYFDWHVLDLDCGAGDTLSRRWRRNIPRP